MYQRRLKPQSLQRKLVTLRPSVPILSLFILNCAWGIIVDRSTAKTRRGCLWIQHSTFVEHEFSVYIVNHTHLTKSRGSDKKTDHQSTDLVFWNGRMHVTNWQCYIKVKYWWELCWYLQCWEPMLLCLLHSQSDGWCQQTSPVINRAGHWGTARVVFLLYSP